MSFESTASAETFHDAVRRGDIQQVRQFIARGQDVNARNEHDLTPLQVSALYGAVDIAKILLSHKANVNMQDARVGCLKTPFLGSIFCPVFGPANIAYSACFYWS